MRRASGEVLSPTEQQDRFLCLTSRVFGSEASRTPDSFGETSYLVQQAVTLFISPADFVSFPKQWADIVWVLLSVLCSSVVIPIAQSGTGQQAFESIDVRGFICEGLLFGRPTRGNLQS